MYGPAEDLDGSELNKVDITLIRHNTCTIIMVSLNLPRRRHLCMQQPYRFWVLTEVLDSQYGNAPIHNGIFQGIFDELFVIVAAASRA